MSGWPPGTARRTVPPVTPSPVPAIVVDDWPLVRLGVARVLHDLDLGPVVESANGRDAVRAARDGGAALLVVGAHTDQPLLDTVRAAKALPAPPRVVVLIGRSDADELRGLLAGDVDALVLRTVGHAELTAAVAQVLAGEKVIAHAALAALFGGQVTQPPVPVSGDGPLTTKERQVLAELAAGASNKEIAAALHVSAGTVKTHLSNIYAKLGAQSRHEAVAQAVQRGLLS